LLVGLCCIGPTRHGWQASWVLSIGPVHAVATSLSAFARFRFPPEVITLAVRWYLRFSLSYRDVAELLAERGVDVDHVTISRWVQRFTPLLAEAARPCRRPVDDRWYVDETYVKAGGVWRYVHRAADQYEQVIDLYVSTKRTAPRRRRSSNRRSPPPVPHRQKWSPTGHRCTRS
jgi:DDE domain